MLEQPSSLQFRGRPHSTFGGLLKEIRAMSCSVGLLLMSMVSCNGFSSLWRLRWFSTHCAMALAGSAMVNQPNKKKIQWGRGEWHSENTGLSILTSISISISSRCSRYCCFFLTDRTCMHLIPCTSTSHIQIFCVTLAQRVRQLLVREKGQTSKWIPLPAGRSVCLNKICWEDLCAHRTFLHICCWEIEVTSKNSVIIEPKDSELFCFKNAI